MNRLILSALLAAASAGATLSTPAFAADNGAVPTCADPCVPQRLRSAPAAPAAPAASGEALQQQAAAKLRQRFDAADQDADGALTVDEARKAGLGYIVNHYDAIDTARAGKVTFDDVRRYLLARRRQALGPAAQ